MLRGQPIHLSFVYPGEHIQVKIIVDTLCGMHCHLLPHPGENHHWCVTSWFTCLSCIEVSIFRWKPLLILCGKHCPPLHYPGENLQEKITVDVAWPAEVSIFRWKSRLILSAISTCPLLAVSRWEDSGGNHRWCHAWWTVPPATNVCRWDCSGASGCNHCWWLVISSSIWCCIQVRMSSQGLLISCSPPVNRFRPDSSCKQNKHDGTFPELGSWEKEHTNCN